MKLKIVLFLLFLLMVPQAWSMVSAEACRRFLADNEVSTDSLEITDQVIAYIKKLTEMQVVTNESLNDFVKNYSNPVPHKIINGTLSIRSEDKAHYDAFEEVLSDPNLDKNKLLTWALNALKKSEVVRKDKEVSKEETKTPYIAMRFERIEPQGKVKHAFQMMTTKVTQHMWAEVMGEISSCLFTEDSKIQKVKVADKEIEMLPDHPITMITFWSVLEFANRLSIKHGLKPAYDLSGIEFAEGTRAEDGSLKVESGKLRFNAPNGDITQTEGYRLPTEIEQIFVLSDRGRSKEQWFTGMTPNNFNDYAWLPKANEDWAIAVGEKQPFPIDGKNFYDLYSNVDEFNNDYSPDHLTWSHNLEKGSQHKKGEQFVTLNRSARGGSILKPFPMPRPFKSYHSIEYNKPAPLVGFRLVRTPK